MENFARYYLRFVSLAYIFIGLSGIIFTVGHHIPALGTIGFILSFLSIFVLFFWFIQFQF
jgi:hypothetical protein